ncbi:putative metabolite transport protein CsbC [Paraburkholderia nemoris]|uniref:MFS transporter n=1 Tax=Paraburkholderia nemoris TaxID=2793076 RepID=UPI00190BE136|nr:MFS transporter [Paraburkholderia nemoris]MBK3742492.1 MFS transporter [Paraburkholderia aspalathi]CAE6789178.1 putative metabolite transport protein CsbC [Paraburkholderia nemoris]
MAGAHFVPASEPPPQTAQLDDALNSIGFTPAHRTILLLIILGGLFDAFEQNSIGIVGPVLRQSWGLTATQIGLLNTVTFSLAALGRLLSGLVGDRYGRRVMLVTDLMLFTLGAIICALAPTFTVLLIGRAIVGFGLGGEISIAVTMLAEFCSARSRGTVVGLLNVGAGGLGNFLAPAFGLLVFSVFSGPDRWRWLFGCLVLPALLGIFYRRIVPETPRFLLSRGDVAQTNLVLAKLASGKLRGTPGSIHEYVSPSDTGAPLRSAFQFAEIFSGALTKRTTVGAFAVWMTYGAQISVLTLMPTILVAQGYTITKSLTFTMVMQGGSLLGAIAASIFGYRLPRKTVLFFGSILACLAALSFGFLAHTVFLIMLCGAAFQFFVLLLNTTIWIYAPELYPTRVRAFGTAFILATGTLAGAIMPLVSGRLFDTYGMVGVFGLIAIMYTIFAGCALLGPETFGRSLENLATPVDENLQAGSAATRLS